MTLVRPVAPAVTRAAPRRSWAPAGGTATTATVLGLGSAYIVLLAWASSNTSYDVWGGVALAPVLLAVNVPLVLRFARRETDPGMGALLVTALVLKLASAVVRYATAFVVYDGFADADTYNDAGALLAPSFRAGDFSVDVGSRLVGTGFVKVLTGLVYAVVGPTSVGGFLVFSVVGFWGMYLFYRAFCTAVSEGDRRRYALLVFLLPSLLFWPSSIGKEAWITLTLGLCAYGAARLLTGQRGAFLLLGLGVTGTAMVRPHMALVAFGAVVFGFIVRRNPNPTPLSGLRRGLTFALLLGVAIVVLGRVQTFFGLSRFDAEGVTQVLDYTQGQTSQGGSGFEAPRATSPAAIPVAVVSVMFRPFPFEARNLQSGLASLEGALLLALFVRARHRILAAVRRVRRHPYVAMALIWVLLFAVAFSSVGNFGIIVRQRVQMLPLALVLLALPATPAAERRVVPLASRARPVTAAS